MSDCPDIVELRVATAGKPGPAIRQHLERCEACSEIVALLAFAGGGTPTAPPAEECVEIEVDLAALSEGHLGGARGARVVDHLRHCAECREVLLCVAASMAAEAVPSAAPSMQR